MKAILLNTSQERRAHLHSRLGSVWVNSRRKNSRQCPRRGLGRGDFVFLVASQLPELMCSCGERMWKCPFWSAVMSDCHLDSGAIRRLYELERAVVRNKFLIANRFDVDAISDHPGVSEYTEWQERIYWSVRRISGREVVVDSSKSGPRAWLLLDHSIQCTCMSIVILAM